MPTFVLLVLVLAGRLVLAVVRGVGHLLLMPARTAMAVAPYSTQPRRVLIGGLMLSAALATLVAVLLLTPR